MLTHWSGHFPTMDLMDPDALAGNGSNAIWRDWRGPLTDRQVAALWTPFYPSKHSSAAPCWREFSMQENNSSWRIDPSWIYSRSGSVRKSYLSLSGFIGMLLQQFSYVCCMRWRRVARLLRRLNLRINFPKFFPHRVFSGNLGVEPSERFHICSNIGNPAPASLLFSNGFRVLDSCTSEYISPEFHFMFLRDGKERLLPLAA